MTQPRSRTVLSEEELANCQSKRLGVAHAQGNAHRRIEGRAERYQIAFPLSGSYPRVRRFLEAALVEIPVLSLDQLALRRKRANDAQIEAEVSFTLHLARP